MNKKPKRGRVKLGQRFNRLTVVEAAPTRTSPKGKKNKFWKCLCDCGGVSEASTHSLRSGHKKSCGCLAEETRKRGRKNAQGETGFQAKLSLYKTCARKRGYSWALSDEDARCLMLGSCYYCGRSKTQTSGAGWTTFKYVGIDRVDNTKGYVTGNVVSCCSTCNYMKREMTAEQMLSHMRQVLTFCSAREEELTCER